MNPETGRPIVRTELRGLLLHLRMPMLGGICLESSWTGVALTAR